MDNSNIHHTEDQSGKPLNTYMKHVRFDLHVIRIWKFYKCDLVETVNKQLEQLI